MRMKKDADDFGGTTFGNNLVGSVLASVAAPLPEAGDMRSTSGRSLRRVVPAALPALKNAPRTSFAVRY